MGNLLGLKVCKRCEKEKPLEDFYKHPETRDRRQPRCIQCMSEAAKADRPHRNATNRVWKKKNRAKVAEGDRRYWRENSEKCNAVHNSWWAKNLDKRKKKDRRFYRKNRDRLLQKRGIWAKENPHIVNAWNATHRARRRNASGKHTGEEAILLLEKQEYRCANPYCAADLRLVKGHKDHKTPITRDGSNDISNLQWLCAPCNLKKGTKTQEEWLASLMALAA